MNLIFALRQHGKLHIHCETFADPLLLPRGERQQALQNAIDHYAARLEHYALQSPSTGLIFRFLATAGSPGQGVKGA